MANLEINDITGQKVYKEILDTGLKIYICIKPGFSKKIGMYGTHYGSIDTDFFDVIENKRKKVPNGIAHFLEHKLFEQEDGNALDMFAKMGVSSNAYTSYDHTAYFFETDNKFEKCVETLFSFITSPYFTDENVEKEKGIIEQELKMYDDSPDSVVYYNVLRAMYNKYPLNIDIGGTVESVYSITKEDLYSSYNSFYNPQNMFVIIIGDVDVEQTIELIKKCHKKMPNKHSQTPKRFYENEENHIAMKEIEKKLDIYMPNICVGFKIGKNKGKENVRNAIITDYINKAFFSDISDFYEDMYKEGILTSPMYLTYESGKDFSHILIFFSSLKYKECENKLRKYIEKIKCDGMSAELFEMVKNKKIGQMIYSTEDLMHVSHEIIASIIEDTNVFEEAKIINSITLNEVNEYLKTKFDFEKMVVSRVLPKE